MTSPITDEKLQAWLDLAKAHQCVTMDELHAGEIEQAWLATVVASQKVVPEKLPANITSERTENGDTYITTLWSQNKPIAIAIRQRDEFNYTVLTTIELGHPAVIRELQATRAERDKALISAEAWRFTMKCFKVHADATPEERYKALEDVAVELRDQLETAERELQAARDAIWQALDDMQESHCVCEDTKQQLRAALPPKAAKQGEADTSGEKDV